MTAQRPDLSPAVVDALLAEIERTIGRDLFNALRSLRDLLSIPALASLILQRSIRDVVDSVPWPVLQNALARAQAKLADVRELGWRGGLHKLPQSILRLPDLRLDLGAYAQQQPTVLDAIRRQDLSRITAITEETREAIRELLTEGLAKGRPPADLARDLRDLIGLNRPQARALLKFRESLERAGRKPDQIERMVARRSTRMLNQRARVIAGNESLRALNEGKRAQWQRLVAEGHLSPDDWEQENVNAGDERVCPICGPLHGVRFPLGGMIQTSVGAFSGPPYHVLCRDVVRLVLKGFRKGEPPAPARDRILAALRGSA